MPCLGVLSHSIWVNGRGMSAPYLHRESTGSLILCVHDTPYTCILYHCTCLYLSLYNIYMYMYGLFVFLPVVTTSCDYSYEYNITSQEIERVTVTWHREYVSKCKMYVHMYIYAQTCTSIYTCAFVK